MANGIKKTKVKILFGSGSIDLVKDKKGKIKIRCDRSGTLRRIMGRSTEISHDGKGNTTIIKPEAVGKMVMGLLE